jgi:hypothetical protein
MRCVLSGRASACGAGQEKLEGFAGDAGGSAVRARVLQPHPRRSGDLAQVHVGGGRVSVVRGVIGGIGALVFVRAGAPCRLRLRSRSRQVLARRRVHARRVRGVRAVSRCLGGAARVRVTAHVRRKRAQRARRKRHTGTQSDTGAHVTYLGGSAFAMRAPKEGARRI